MSFCLPRGGQGWGLRKSQRRGELHSHFTRSGLERGDGHGQSQWDAEPGRKERQVFGSFSSFPSQRQPLPVEWDLLSGGNCSIMARTPCPAASLSHATDNLSHVPSRHGTILHIQPKGSWSVTTHYLVRSIQVGFLPHESIEGNVVLRLLTACEQSPWVIPVLDATFLWATSAGGLPHSQLLTVGVGFFKDSLVMFENMFPKWALKVWHTLLKMCLIGVTKANALCQMLLIHNTWRKKLNGISS